MYADLPKPTLFAHRGASAYAPENTLAAFKLAVRQNADGIELDAKLTADNHIVVIHDQTLERTTNGEGKVSDLPLNRLQELDAGGKFDQSFRGERIPTLHEVLEAVGKETFTNIELTNYASPRDSLPEKVAEIIKQHGLQERILFSSFNPISLRRIHKILPKVPLGLLAMPGFSGLWARSFIGRWVPYQALHPFVRDTHKNLVNNCHKGGYRVHTYTVNQPETIDPLLAQQTLNSYQIDISEAL